jgi:hypothetical protein
MRNVAPWPGSLVTSMAPSWAWTMPWTTERPRPVPRPGALVVKNGIENAFARGAVHAPAVVADGELEMGAGADAAEAVGGGFVEVDGQQVDFEAAGASVEGVPGVGARG